MKNSAAGLLTSLDDLFSTQEEREAAVQPRVEDIPIDLIPHRRLVKLLHAINLNLWGGQPYERNNQIQRRIGDSRRA